MFVIPFTLLCIILAVLVVIDIALFLTDRYILSFFVLVAGVVGFAFFGFTEPFVDTMKNIVFNYVPYYLAIGALVAFVKWFIHCMRVGSKLKELAVAFKTSNWKLSYAEEYARRGEAFDDNAFIRFLNYVNIQLNTTSNMRPNGIGNLLRDREFDNTVTYHVTTKADMDTILTPKAKKQKTRITFWVLQWPIVVITMFVEDFLVKIGHRVAELLDFMMGKVARMFVARATAGIGE